MLRGSLAVKAGLRFSASFKGSQKFVRAAQFSSIEKPFDKILIANRGEIACRVMRTAKRLGVKTVAVYSDVDASAMHVRLADEAFCIGTAKSADSYLKYERILDVAKKTGAQAIHPGYGFLSENGHFVDMCEAAGIVFLGPPSAAMHSMGDKISSKKVALDAGCYIIPGFQGEVADVEEAVRLARDEVGYPVMIKASAGGGGKGMRIAYTDDEVREGFTLSKAEALSSFGDDRMLIERFIENPHHIEIQVLADTHGNVVAFPERECSVQRRNQKVVEESPSCLITPETRKKMQEQAIMLCKATNYRSAGTIEMLADEQQNFFFLEMNTRLQVEHPITELVTGEDIVEHMLYIGAGKPLPKRLTDITHLPAKGSAIECRVYAEDPTRNFLPSIGPLITYRQPQTRGQGSGDVMPFLLLDPNNKDATSLLESTTTVRVDTGVCEGATISMHYDPMISKLCSHAATREQAIKTMEEALDNYVVQGLGNNISFLRSIMRNKRFCDGLYSTKFIGQEYPKGFTRVELNSNETMQMIAAGAALHQARMEILEEKYRELRRERAAATRPATLPEDDDDYLTQVDEFVVVLGGPKGDGYSVKVVLDDKLTATITPMTGDNAGKSQQIVVGDLDWRCEEPLAHFTFLGESADGIVADKKAVQYLGRTAEGYVMRFLGCEQEVIVRTPEEHKLSCHMLAPEVRDFSSFVVCPMPGTLISCNIVAGQRVEIGQQLAVIEAMKMQNVLRAERAGIIKSVLKKAGNSLKVDEIIMEYEVEAEAKA